MIAQPVAHEVHSQHGQQHRQTRKERDPPRRRQKNVALADVATFLHRRELLAELERVHRAFHERALGNEGDADRAFRRAVARVQPGDGHHERIDRDGRDEDVGPPAELVGADEGLEPACEQP